jgi:hypothetical protein
MDDTPPEQRTALLPVEKLKQPSLEQFRRYTVKEFRLKGSVLSLKDFVDFSFLEKNGKYDMNRIVCITENSFVELHGPCLLPYGCYRCRLFGLKLGATADVSWHDHSLGIHASSTEDAFAALELLAGLQDSYFTRMELNVDGIGRSVRSRIVS